MAKAKITIELEDYIDYHFEYITGKEVVYGTTINTLIYDENGNIIASDDYTDHSTSEYFVTPEETKTVYEYTDEYIVKKYIFGVNWWLKKLNDLNGDDYKHWQSLQNCGLDWEDIQYNEDLWFQYKPLYNLLKNKGYEMEVELAA